MANSDIDNRSNQMNPNNDAYYQSRGYEGPEDSYDTCSYLGPYIAGPQPRYPIPTSEEKAQRFLYQERKRIAASMTTAKATEILWNLLLNDFPELGFDAAFGDCSVHLFVTGCLPASDLAQSVETTISKWLEERHWLIGECVKGVQVNFNR